MKKYAEELGLEFQTVETDRDRHAVLLSWRSDCSTEKSLVLNSHIDVVPVFEEHWTVPPFSGEIRDGKIYGRGSQDMKCVGIQYLEAIRRLKQMNFQPKRDLHCLFVPDEEIGGARGMKPFLEMKEFKDLNVGFVFDEGLASETDVYQVFYGDRANTWLDFELRGNTGHGSRLIENTVGEKAQFVINEMLAYRSREEKRLKESQNTDKPLQLGEITTINFTKMSGGVQTNVVPDLFKISFDCRIRPGGYQEFHAFLADVIRRTPKQHDDEVKTVMIDSGDLLLTDVKNPSWWLDSLKKTFAELNLKLNWTVFPAGTDSRYLRNAGYPAIGFSPMIHTPILLHDHDEFLSKDVFLRGIEIYVKLIGNIAVA